MEKADFKNIQKEQGVQLGELQRKLKNAGIPVVIVFEGVDGAGKGTQINFLLQALDPRGFDVYASSRRSEDEMMRPFLWKFWSQTPEKGRISIYDQAWYRRILLDQAKVPEAYDDIKGFERQLSDDGVVIIKLFLHIDQGEQKKRFEKLESSKETKWRVTKEDWKRNKNFDEYLQNYQDMVWHTNTDYAPWIKVEVDDKREASITIMRYVIQRMEAALTKKVDTLHQYKTIKQKPVLSKVDLNKTLTREEYKLQLDALQDKLELLHSQAYRLRIPVVLGFEGWDAAGKGGAIRRLTSHLDPRGYAVHPTASPNDIEKKHHYLWRFWNHMPKAGHIGIFDRTWYGRVMVERIEGFCSEDEWKRAYDEINEMEAHMTNSGAIVLKFWIHIDKDEQKRRFEERQENPEKQWKITDEDWRNREKWDEYEIAVDEMLIRTSTKNAPWVVVEGNCKYYARVKVLETVVNALEKKIKERLADSK